jgi:hypothetical protein
MIALDRKVPSMITFTPSLDFSEDRIRCGRLDEGLCPAVGIFNAQDPGASAASKTQSGLTGTLLVGYDSFCRMLKQSSKRAACRGGRLRQSRFDDPYGQLFPTHGSSDSITAISPLQGRAKLPLVKAWRIGLGSKLPRTRSIRRKTTHLWRFSIVSTTWVTRPGPPGTCVNRSEKVERG